MAPEIEPWRLELIEYLSDPAAFDAVLPLLPIVEISRRFQFLDTVREFAPNLGDPVFETLPYFCENLQGLCIAEGWRRGLTIIAGNHPSEPV